MEDNRKKDVLLEEHIRKIKYRTNYKISESARYSPIVNMGEVFDEVPRLTNEAGEQEDAEKAGGGAVPPAPSNDQPITAGEPPVPDFDKTGDAPEADGMPPEEEPMPQVDPAQEVNSIQNDIIKHNIEAMKSIHDTLKSLDDNVKALDARMNTLNADVEEVREPTNTEKLMSKKNVSYPYYFNLNDFWTGNWFNENREKELGKGIKELPDGSFVADFDDLPQDSKNDVQNSFNQMNE